MSALIPPVAPQPLSTEETAEFMHNMLTELQIVLLTVLLILDACAFVSHLHDFIATKIFTKAGAGVVPLLSKGATVNNKH